jgi:hypothetical protein
MWRRVLVVLVLVAVATLITVTWPQGEAVTPAFAPAPAPAPVVNPPVGAAALPLTPPAGERESVVGQVTIALERDGKPEVGPRITLRDAEGAEEGRTTDVMGLATFSLPLGSWLVMEPREVAGEAIEVTREPRRVTLTMPSLRRVDGEVLDDQGGPVSDVAITAEGAPLARTDARGHFAFTTVEQTLLLSATTGRARVTKQVSAPASGVQLRLELVTKLSLLSAANRLTVSVSSRSGTTTHEVHGNGEIEVPVGELDVTALAVVRGKLQRARHRLVTHADQGAMLKLDFAAPPPVSGVVRDPTGTPLAGVTVGLTLAPSKGDALPRVQETTVTDAQGHFEIVPAIVRGGDPVYEVHLLPPWREKSAVLVRLGDTPLLVDAEVIR